MGKVVSRVKGEARVSNFGERKSERARGRERECMRERDGDE